METKKMYEQPQVEVVELKAKYNILTESLGGGEGKAGEGEGDSPQLNDDVLEF